MTPPGADLGIPTIQAALGGRYEVNRVIARGGMAIVYLAQDRELGRQVAVKVLDPDLSESQPMVAERFLREDRGSPPGCSTRTSSRSRFRPGRGPGLCYVMPYVEGESLRDRLMRQPASPSADALLWAREIAEALELRAPARHRPSRHQAREHPALRRPRGGRRLRHRPRSHRRGRATRSPPSG